MKRLTLHAACVAGLVVLASSRTTLADPPDPTTDAATIPVAASVLGGIGATGLVVGLMSFPMTENAVSPGPELTGIALGVGALGLASACVVIWVTPSTRPHAAHVRAAAGPSGAWVTGRF